MKKIGLIGGTGPESTIMYYKELNHRIGSITEYKELPEIVIESVDLIKALDYVSKKQYDELLEHILEKIEHLEKSGAEIISLTAVTMHIIFDQINERGIKLVSIPKTIADEAVSKGIKKVGLIGTKFTMQEDYMKKDLINAGVEVIVPNEDNQDLIGKRIYDELEKGIVKESTLKEFVSIIKTMQEEEEIEAIILGCTELPLLLNNDNCPVECLDSVEIHINKLIELATEQ